ncbi:MAG: hypothetical protein A2Z07_12645 [Armatimonadetes bacterium RBG_16_67_12]|nr:MAG: hypothetical protein A2Z07_12645 [Armatimonadetes bacterium RBG_16_67_12]
MDLMEHGIVCKRNGGRVLLAGSIELHERGLALSLRITSNRLGEVVSPIVLGALVTWTGIGGAFLRRRERCVADTLIR